MQTRTLLIVILAIIVAWILYKQHHRAASRCALAARASSLQRQWKARDLPGFDTSAEGYMSQMAVDATISGRQIAVAAIDREALAGQKRLAKISVVPNETGLTLYFTDGNGVTYESLNVVTSDPKQAQAEATALLSYAATLGVQV